MKPILDYFSAGICIASSVALFLTYIINPYTLLECIGIIILIAILFAAGCYLIVRGVKSQIG